jgi:hypothetical protein
MKKGDLNRTQLAVLIIASLSFILLLLLIPTIAKFFNAKSDDAVCKQSVLLNNMMKSKSFNIKETGLACPATSYTFSEKTKNEYYYDMYDLLNRCWDKTLGKDNRLATTFWFGQPYAFVCYSFSLKGEELTGKEFAAYLSMLDPQTKKVRAPDTDWKSPDNSQFLVEVIDRGKDDIQFKEMDKIDPKETYLVVFSSYVNRKLFWTNIVNDKDLYGAAGWEITYRLIKDVDKPNEYSNHVFIIKESEFINLKANTYFWEQPDEKK